MIEEKNKLDFITQQNEQLILLLATLIRTLENKGVFTEQDFYNHAAIGKALEQSLTLFGVNRK